MKKSLVIISFAFIFLLSMSVVSAGFFDWITGDVGSRKIGTDILPTAVSKDTTGNTFSRTSTSSSTGTTSARKSQASECPSRRWTMVEASGGGYFCRKEEATGKSGLFSR